MLTITLNGVCIEDATNFKRSRTDNALCRTMSKIYMYVKCAEKENGIEVLKQTVKRNQKYGKREMYACPPYLIRWNAYRSWGCDKH